MGKKYSTESAERNAAEHRNYAVISQVAHMYYDLNMPQPEIAEKLFFSRSKVSRMLKQARKLGIVEINVRHIVDRTPSLEKKLTALFGLKEALVITCFEEQRGEDAFQALTDFAALHISGLLRGPRKVGITNGKTIKSFGKYSPVPLKWCSSWALRQILF